METHDLLKKAQEIRQLMVCTILKTQSGHPGGSFSIVDVLAALYFHIMNIDPAHPQWEDRDRFILSKGHASLALYSTLALRGYFNRDCMDILIIGILLAFLAGLSTTIGSLMVFFIKDLKPSYLAFSLAFSTGVMITLSFIELLPEGMEAIGYGNGLFWFFLGAAIIFLIDYFVPHEHIMERVSKSRGYNPKLLKTGAFIALGMAIHNFPEGFAVFVGPHYNLNRYR